MQGRLQTEAQHNDRLEGMKIFKRILLNVLYVSLGVLMGLIWGVKPRETVLGIDPVPSSETSLMPGVEVTLEPGNFILAKPVSPNGTVFVYYPGGRVPAQSYEFIARALAANGVTVAIPVMPLELAVISPNRASEVRTALEAGGMKISKFVVGGHSLGGAMAAKYAFSNPVDGLILMGAYSVDDLTGKSFKVLDIAAEHDGLATPEKVKDGLEKLPSGSKVDIIAGGVHAFFGRYGPQAGDGSPTVARDVFEKALLEKLNSYFQSLQ
jgi:predicted esterase